MSYRINYGNGQVSIARDTYDAARKEYEAQVRYDRRHGQSCSGMYIQRYEGNGEWFRCSDGKDKPSVD